jgi:hypothetical protein
MNKQYLGDGVYVENSDGQLKLTTEPLGEINIIYLEPEVMNALIEYYKKLVGVNQL